jgi:RNA polymerase sigma-70 factor (ECF subfamily)
VHRDDSEIIRLIQSEETRPEGFNRLVNRYKTEVYWLIRRMVIDHNDADDLSQETFIKIWSNLSGFRGESALFTWIYRIATNEALLFLRKKRIRAIFSLSSVENTLASALQNDAFYQADETQDRFQKALLELPDKQRLVFNLKYFDSVTFDQMSEITGTSVGALKASYHHAVKKIKDKLTDR